MDCMVLNTDKHMEHITRKLTEGFWEYLKEICVVKLYTIGTTSSPENRLL